MGKSICQKVLKNYLKVMFFHVNITLQITRCLPARFDRKFLFENIDEERFQGTGKIKTSAKFGFHME